MRKRRTFEYYALFYFIVHRANFRSQVSVSRILMYALLIFFAVDLMIMLILHKINVRIDPMSNIKLILLQINIDYLLRNKYRMI